MFSSRKTRQGHILSALDDMKQQSNMVEENLGKVMFIQFLSINILHVIRTLLVPNNFKNSFFLVLYFQDLLFYGEHSR